MASEIFIVRQKIISVESTETIFIGDHHEERTFKSFWTRTQHERRNFGRPDFTKTSNEAYEESGTFQRNREEPERFHRFWSEKVEDSEAVFTSSNRDGGFSAQERNLAITFTPDDEALTNEANEAQKELERRKEAATLDLKAAVRTLKLKSNNHVRVLFPTNDREQQQAFFQQEKEATLKTLEKMDEHEKEHSTLRQDLAKLEASAKEFSEKLQLSKANLDRIEDEMKTAFEVEHEKEEPGQSNNSLEKISENRDTQDSDDSDSDNVSFSSDGVDLTDSDSEVEPFVPPLTHLVRQESVLSTDSDSESERQIDKTKKKRKIQKEKSQQNQNQERKRAISSDSASEFVGRKRQRPESSNSGQTNKKLPSENRSQNKSNDDVITIDSD